MTVKPRYLIGLSVLLLILTSALGGSAFWFLIGVSDDLNIDGRAIVQRAAPAGLGEDWPLYGGDAGGNRYSSATDSSRENVGQLQVAMINQQPNKAIT